MVASSKPYEQGSVLTHNVNFAGDQVQLAGQIDYPSAPIPLSGYPLIFILQNAGCTGRGGYDSYARMGTSAGYAVFRWDKRGTGASGSSGNGSAEMDALKAYKTALKLSSVDRQRAIILAQSEGTLLLHKHYDLFVQEQSPRALILIGNMLNEDQIVKLPEPVHFITGDEDWNNWKRYARGASQAHSQHHDCPPSYYVAQNANRRLKDMRDGYFHNGAAAQLKDWLALYA